jgi:hypothetical protein
MPEAQPRHLDRSRKEHVISTEGGAFAAVVERPLYCAVAVARFNLNRDSSCRKR